MSSAHEAAARIRSKPKINFLCCDTLALSIESLFLCLIEPDDVAFDTCVESDIAFGESE